MYYIENKDSHLVNTNQNIVHIVLF